MSEWDDIFEEEAAKRRAQADAFDRDPIIIAKREAATARRAALIEREIAEGLRDADGNPIEREEEDEPEEEEDDGEDEE